jgi:membrane protein DedA with SNARE-associated domain
MKKNIKDQVSNIAGLILAISGAIAGAGAAGIALPKELMTACILAAAVSGSVIGYLTGKPTNIKP